MAPKWLMKASTIAFTVLLPVTSVTVLPQDTYAQHHQHADVEYEYSDHVMHALFVTFKRETCGPISRGEILEKVEDLTMVQAMDRYLDFVGKTITADEVEEAVEGVFDVSLQIASDAGAGTQVGTYSDDILSGIQSVLKKDVGDVESYIQDLSKLEVFELYLESLGKHPEGPEIRQAINQIFGINLDGVSKLEGIGIAIYSKEQWIIQSDQDYFIIDTGLTDVDVSIRVTDYYTELTGETELPDELARQLEALGYYYNEEVGTLYYANPTGESVPDEFKGKTIGTLIQYIMQNLAH